MRPLPREKGFSLLMIVLIFVVVAAAGVGAAFFAAKIKTIAAERQTNKRMLAIQAAAEQYYRGHPDTGLPGPSPGAEVPVQAAALNLPQSHRYDAWGKPFEYYRDPGGDIVGIYVDTTDDSVVNGNRVAGYILSGGLNQKIESSVLPGSPPSITKTGDDILLPINVQAEAIEIAMAELVVLSQKSCAFIKAHPCGSPLILANLIIEYSLNATYQTDPWGHPYRQQAGNNFSSDGPDGVEGGTDDIYGPPLGSECVCPPPPPISGFSFDPADITTLFGLFVVVAPSAGGANATGFSFPANGISPQSSGGADGGGYISFNSGSIINTGLRVNQDLRPSVHPKLTVSVWIRSNTTTGTQAVFSTDTNATPQLERLIRETGGNYAVSSGFSGSGSYSDGPVTTGTTWHHLAAVYDQTVPNVTLYLDNVAVIGPSPANMPDNQVSQLGSYVYFIGVRGPVLMFPGAQWIFNGDIDEFRIYPDALSAAQINVLYHEFH
jgi:type II secretory pathway pseudopilin PulG